jgi:hypothetical protein
VNKGRKLLKQKIGYGVKEKKILKTALDIAPVAITTNPLIPSGPIAGLVAHKGRKVLKEKTRYGKAKTIKKVAKAVISTGLDILPMAFT